MIFVDNEWHADESNCSQEIAIFRAHRKHRFGLPRFCVLVTLNIGSLCTDALTLKAPNFSKPWSNTHFHCVLHVGHAFRVSLLIFFRSPIFSPASRTFQALQQSAHSSRLSETYHLVIEMTWYGHPKTCKYRMYIFAFCNARYVCMCCDVYSVCGSVESRSLQCNVKCLVWTISAFFCVSFDHWRLTMP